MTKRRVSLVVSGRVQGVYYRASACDEARRLGLTGWVRNCPGGDVEAEVEGDGLAVAAFIAWCHDGPPAARVASVRTQEGTVTGEFDGFAIAR